MWYWTSKLWPLVYIGISYIVLIGVWFLIDFTIPNHIESEKDKRKLKNFSYTILYNTTLFIWGLIESIMNPQYFFILKGEDSESCLALVCFGFAAFTFDSVILATTKGINGCVLFLSNLHHVIAVLIFAYFILLGRYKATILIAMITGWGAAIASINLLLKAYKFSEDSWTFRMMQVLAAVAYAANKVVTVSLFVWIIILHYDEMDWADKAVNYSSSCIVTALNFYQGYHLFKKACCPDQPTEAGTVVWFDW